MILRDYQIDIVSKGKTILKQFGIVYLAMEVRTGKTATALTIANDFKRVLFITKKKAIQSILDDFSALNYKYELVVINNESLHKIDGKFDLIISDEHHRNATYPKPNLSAKFIRANFANLPMIFLSVFLGVLRASVVFLSDTREPNVNMFFPWLLPANSISLHFPIFAKKFQK